MSEYVLEDLNGFAVDLGGTKIAAAHIRDGQVENPVLRQTDGTVAPTRMVSELSDILHQIGFAAGQPVGVAVAGKLDAAGRWSAVNPSILKDLTGIPLALELERQLGAPVTVLNDTQAAAMGEYRFGAGRWASSLAYLTVSTGISAGFVFEGRLLRSQNGMLGHVGFLTSRVGRGACGCGRTGTFESIASGRAIEAQTLELGHGQIDCEGIFKAAAAGALWARDVIDSSCAAVAELCANLVAAFGVERVVLGGGVGLARGYFEQVQKHLRDEPAQFQPQIVPAALGKHSVLLGVLSYAQSGGDTR